MRKLLQTIVLTQLVFTCTDAPTASAADEPVSVAYRLKETKTLHFDDPAKARQHLDAVRRLGCEARMDDHGGHLDVSCRQTAWTALTLSSEDTAHQWNLWLVKAGFETIHAHGENHDHSAGHSDHNHGSAELAPFGAQSQPATGHFHGDGHDHGHVSGEVVTYSILNWQTTHTKDQLQAAQLRAVLQGLGCEVQTKPHDDHDDVVFRCPRPMHLELPSHAVAAHWENWLQGAGFRTQHVH